MQNLVVIAYYHLSRILGIRICADTVPHALFYVVRHNMSAYEWYLDQRMKLDNRKTYKTLVKQYQKTPTSTGSEMNDRNAPKSFLIAKENNEENVVCSAVGC